MIRTALLGTALAVAAAGLALVASPAQADDDVTFTVIGGYGITVSCNTVVASGHGQTICAGTKTNSGAGNAIDSFAWIE